MARAEAGDLGGDLQQSRFCAASPGRSGSACRAPASRSLVLVLVLVLFVRRGLRGHSSCSCMRAARSDYAGKVARSGRGVPGANRRGRRSSATGRFVTRPRSMLTPSATPGSAPATVSPALVGELEDVGERHVAEGIRARPADRAGHVGDAVVDDAVDDVGRLAVRGRAAGLDAAPLVDRHVHDDRAGLHPRQVVAADQARGPAPVIRMAPMTRSARSIDSRIVCRSE